MSLFLVVAPKKPVASVERDVGSIVESLEANSGNFLGPRYARTPQIDRDLNPSGVTLVQWLSGNGRDYDTFASVGGKWAVSSTNGTANSLAGGIKTRAGAARFDEPVWGSFSAVHGDRNSSRLLAWNTVPAVDPIYFGEDDGFIYISNRPIICKLARERRRLKPSDLNPDYLIEYLEFGHSFSEATPFLGVERLPPRAALSVWDGHYSFTPVPVMDAPEVIEKHDDRYTGADELTQSLLNAAARCEARRGYDDLQLRLSGGFDSRLLLGLFKQVGSAGLFCVTHGVESDNEVRIASQLCRAASVPHVVKAPEPLVGADYFASLLESITQSGGLIPSESLVAPFSPTAPSEGAAISLGQWPLFKGYLDKVPTSDEDAIYERLIAKTSGLVNAELTAYCENKIGNWLSSMSAVSNVEVLYNFARDQRSSRYLEAQTSQIDRECEIYYPMVDSEVTYVSDQLPLANRAQNYASFFALRNIWSDALAVPFNTTQTLRFEANNPVPGISGDDYQARRSEPAPFVGSIQGPSYTGTQFARVLGFLEYFLALHVKSNPSWHVICRLIKPEVLDTINKLIDAGETASRRVFEDRASRKRAQVGLSRLVLAEMWLSGSWLD